VTIWDEFSSESGESNESNEDMSLEINFKSMAEQKGEKTNGERLALNKCLSIVNSEKIRPCVVQLCAKNCQAINQKSEGKCITGCQLQSSIFLESKKHYQKTKPDYLLGQVLDKCWDGCDSMKLISYSDVASCVKGCNEMRKLQKKEIEDSIIDYKENISGNIGQESTDHVEETDVARIDGTGIRTFVVVKNGDWDAVSSDDFYRSLVSLMDTLFSDIQPLAVSSQPGYQGDRDQLDIPRIIRPQAQRLVGEVNNGPGWVERVEDNAGSFLEEMKATLRSRQAQEMLFYILVCISCFMLLSAIMDLCGLKTRKNLEEDDEEDTRCSLEHEYKTKLPTYDECMMAEPCKVKVDVGIHSLAAEKNIINM